MKVFEINGGVFGSTGRIMFGIAAEARKRGIEVRCASPITSTNKNQQPIEEYYKIGNNFSGYFSYQSDGFGPVTMNEEKTVDELYRIIQNDFANDEEYLHRSNEFFCFP